ncbi:hypothetical protein [Candidatus Endolissoclinum faulkneri]|uniref:hypothetical protein n=1 Tax=Candidatus Endolissoclinum faulkneri TaxID=1263979 RepID=UPI001183C379|nr:hypothetical protein [Candidatus Endolissoclinum faulkneri]
MLGSCIVNKNNWYLEMRFAIFLLFLLVLTIVSGAVVLLKWEIPAPTAPVRKIIPENQFPH